MESIPMVGLGTSMAEDGTGTAGLSPGSDMFPSEFGAVSALNMNAPYK